MVEKLTANSSQFSPVVFLDHTPTIQLTTGAVWQETVSAFSARTYTETPQPVTPPTTASPASDSSLKLGISLIAFNADGTLVATRDDATPSTVWLWDLTQLTPRTVLIQHAPVKQLLWHPAIPDLLMTQCAHDEPALYLWSAALGAPEVLAVPLQKGTGAAGARLEARWLPTARDRKPALVFGHAQGYVLVWLQGKDPVLRLEREGEGGGGEEGEGDSEDSLYDILTGRTPLPNAEDTGRWEEVEEDDNGGLEDTFRERRRGREELRESGLSEMF